MSFQDLLNQFAVKLRREELERQAQTRNDDLGQQSPNPNISASQPRLERVTAMLGRIQSHFPADNAPVVTAPLPVTASPPAAVDVPAAPLQHSGQSSPNQKAQRVTAMVGRIHPPPLSADTAPPPLASAPFSDSQAVDVFPLQQHTDAKRKEGPAIEDEDADDDTTPRRKRRSTNDNNITTTTTTKNPPSPPPPLPPDARPPPSIIDLPLSLPSPPPPTILIEERHKTERQWTRGLLGSRTLHLIVTLTKNDCRERKVAFPTDWYKALMSRSSSFIARVANSNNTNDGEFKEYVVDCKSYSNKMDPRGYILRYCF